MEVKTDIITDQQRKNVKFCDKELIDRINKCNKIREDAMYIYTDGSKKKEGISTGASMVFEGRDIAYNISLPKESSIFTAEVFAIKCALEFIYLENMVNNKDVVILTDSKSAVQEICNNVISVYKNMYICDIKKYIELLSRNKNVRTVIAWIPAHVGIRGNEMADKLAKEATEEPASDEIVVPIGDFRKGFKEETWKETQKRIKMEGNYKGKHYMERFYEENKKKPWFHKINTERFFYYIDK